MHRLVFFIFIGSFLSASCTDSTRFSPTAITFASAKATEALVLSRRDSAEISESVHKAFRDACAVVARPLHETQCIDNPIFLEHIARRFLLERQETSNPYVDCALSLREEFCLSPYQNDSRSFDDEERYAGCPAVLPDICYRRALFAVENGKFERAERLIARYFEARNNQTLDHFDYLTPRVEALHIETLHALGKIDDNSTIRFLAKYPDSPYNAKFRRYLAQNALKSGNGALASQYCRYLRSRLPFFKDYALCQELFDNLSLPPEDISQALNDIDFLRRFRQWKIARERIDELEKRAPDNADLLWQKARNHFDSGDFEQAEAIYKKIERDFPNFEKRICHDLMRLSAYTQNTEAFRAYLKKNIDKYFSHVATSKELSYLREFGFYAEAYEMQKKWLKKEYKGNRKKMPPIPCGKDFNEVFLAYLAGAYDDALFCLQSLLPDASGRNKVRIRYFIAQSLSKLERFEAAVAEFASITQSNPNSYYAILAASRLEDFINPDRAAFAVVDWTRFDPKPDFRPLSVTPYLKKQKIQNDFADFVGKKNAYFDIFPSLPRAIFYHSLGENAMRHKAVRHALLKYRQIIKNLPKKTRKYTEKNLKIPFDNSILHLIDNRKNKRSVWGADPNDIASRVPMSREDIERWVARMNDVAQHEESLKDFFKELSQRVDDYYLQRISISPDKVVTDFEKSALFLPRAFPDAIIEKSALCQNENFSPYYAWTVMNIESAFNPDSVSHADAYGLMQVIPMTATKIAQARENPLSDFSFYDLIEYERSIEYGVQYLCDVVSKFRGQLPLALAGYNGGPHFVDRWLKTYGKNIELDAFVEEIPFNEARRYVSKGLERLLMYKKIYSENSDAMFYLGNKINTDVEKDPNF